MLDALASWWHRSDAAAMAVHERAAPILPILGILALGLGAIFVGPLVMWWLGPPEEPFRWPFRSRRYWWDVFPRGSGRSSGGSGDTIPDLGAGSDGDWV